MNAETGSEPKSPKKRGRIPQSAWPQILERYHGGATLSAIAREFECTPSAISYIIKKAEAAGGQGELNVATEPESDAAVAAPASDAAPPAATSEAAPSVEPIAEPVAEPVAEAPAAAEPRREARPAARPATRGTLSRTPRADQTDALPLETPAPAPAPTETLRLNRPEPAPVPVPVAAPVAPRRRTRHRVRQPANRRPPSMPSKGVCATPPRPASRPIAAGVSSPMKGPSSRCRKRCTSFARRSPASRSTCRPAGARSRRSARSRFPPTARRAAPNSGGVFATGPVNFLPVSLKSPEPRRRAGLFSTFFP